MIAESAGDFGSSETTDDDTVPGIRLEHLYAGAASAPVQGPVADQPSFDRIDDPVADVLPASVPVLSAPAPAPGEPAAVEAAAPQTAPSQPVNASPVPAPPPSSPATGSDLEAVAGLCTAFARVVDRNEVQRLLHEAARILDAIGLIVWVWDATAEALMPALVYGYSDKVLAQLPTVRRDGDNVTAAAFRTGQTCELPGNAHSGGALVVPLLTPDGCAGVLALELHQGVEETRAIRAAATILAAVVTQLVLRIRIAESRAQSLKSPLRVRGERGSRNAGSQIGQLSWFDRRSLSRCIHVHGACGALPAFGGTRRHDDTTTTTLRTQPATSARRGIFVSALASTRYQRLSPLAATPAAGRRRSAAPPTGSSPSK